MGLSRNPLLVRAGTYLPSFGQSHILSAGMIPYLSFRVYFAQVEFAEVVILEDIDGLQL